MEIIQKLTSYGDILTYVIGGIFFIGAAIFMYLKHTGFKFKKSVDKTDYSSYPKKASVEFINLKDIKQGVIIHKGGTRVTAGIQVFGLDYHTAHPSERLNVQRVFIEFMNGIEAPIQKMNQAQRVDLDGTLAMYEEAQQKTLLELEAVETELGVLANTINETLRKNGESDPNLPSMYARQAALDRSARNRRDAYDHLAHQIAYAKSFTESNNDPVQNQYYFFSYEHNKLDFVSELSEEDILDRAVKHLQVEANNRIGILKRCGLNASLLTSTDLADVLRRHYAPDGADLFKFRDYFESNCFDMVTTTDSHTLANNEALAQSTVESLIKEVS